MSGRARPSSPEALRAQSCSGSTADRGSRARSNCAPPPERVVCGLRQPAHIAYTGVAHEAVAITLEEPPQLVDARQRDEVARHEELVVEPAERVLDLHFVAITAQEQSDRQLVAVLAHALPEPVQIEVHLPRVAVLERAQLQVDEHVAAQLAVVEDEIDALRLARARLDSELPRLEAEPRAELEQERLQMLEQRALASPRARSTTARLSVESPVRS